MLKDAIMDSKTLNKALGQRTKLEVNPENPVERIYGHPQSF